MVSLFEMKDLYLWYLRVSRIHIGIRTDLLVVISALCTLLSDEKDNVLPMLWSVSEVWTLNAPLCFICKLCLWKTFNPAKQTSAFTPQDNMKVTGCCISTFLQQLTLFSTAWKCCTGCEVIVKLAHAFLFWPCLPTTMCSTPLHLLIFTSSYNNLHQDTSPSLMLYVRRALLHWIKLFIVLFSSLSPLDDLQQAVQPHRTICI